MLNLLVIYEMYNAGYNVESLNILTVLTILTAISVIISKNPILSVLFLIGLFIGIAIYLVLIGLSFLGLSYLLVYVGAVSILFLFILMLLNVRISELISETKNSIPLVFITAICFNMPINDLTSNNISIINTENNLFKIFANILNKDTIYNITSQTWDNNVVSSNHINSIGNIMYTSHNVWLILVSLILLLAMVGAIVITLNHKENIKVTTYT